MNTAQQLMQRGLSALDPWLDAVFPIATALICARQRLAGYSLLVIYLLLRLLQRSDREPWRWILISLLVVNAGLIIEDRDFKPGGPSDYLIISLGFAAGFQRTRKSWRTNLWWMASSIVPLLAFSLAAGDRMIQLNSSFTDFNINIIGFLAGLLCIFSYSLLDQSRNLIIRLASAALLAGGLTESLLTQSRAAIAVPLLSIAIDQASRIQWSKKKAGLAGVALTAILLLTLHSWYARTPGNTNTIADKNRITTIRCWVDRTTKTTESFLLGQGYGKATSKKCGPDRAVDLVLREKPLAHSHNLYIQLLGETGIFGLLLGIVLSVQAFRKGWSRDLDNKNLPNRPLTTYLLLMAMGATWHSMLLNQVLVGYSLAALTATDRDPSAADAATPATPPGASAPQG